MGRKRQESPQKGPSGVIEPAGDWLEPGCGVRRGWRTGGDGAAVGGTAMLQVTGARRRFSSVFKRATSAGLAALLTTGILVALPRAVAPAGGAPQRPPRPPAIRRPAAEHRPRLRSAPFPRWSADHQYAAPGVRPLARGC